MPTRTKLFTSNRTQAVRLPKDVRFPDGVTTVEVLKVGNARLIVPQGESWNEFFDNGPYFSADLLARRDDPPAQEQDFTW
jgi:antitoxin VapB